MRVLDVILIVALLGIAGIAVIAVLLGIETARRVQRLEKSALVLLDAIEALNERSNIHATSITGVADAVRRFYERYVVLEQACETTLRKYGTVIIPNQTEPM